MQAGIAGNESGNDSKDMPGIIQNSNDKDNQQNSKENVNTSIENQDSEIKSEQTPEIFNNVEEEQNNQTPLINLTKSIANALLNNEKNNTNELEIKNSSSSPKENDNNNENDIEEEESEENEEEEQTNQKSNDSNNKKDEEQHEVDETENNLPNNISEENKKAQSDANKAELPSTSKENKLQNLSNSIINQLVSKNNKEYEYEYEEEEEEEEEEYEDKSTKNTSKKHLPPSHLLEEHQIPNSEPRPKKPKSETIEDLENEVMITGVATPKTEIDEENNNNNLNKSKKTNKSKNKTKINDNNGYTEEDIEKELTKYLKTKKLPDQSILEDVASLARQKTLQMMIDEEYDNAYKMKEAAEQLSINFKDGKRIYMEKEMNEIIESRITEANQQQKDINYKYKDKIEEFEKLQKLSKEKLLEKHQNEIYHFYEEWEDEKKLLPYLKQSPQLLQLRQMQKTQAFAMNFEQAKQLKKAADKLQKDETQTAKLNASNAMKTEYDALIKQQQIEVDSWNQNWERKRQIIEMEKKQEEEANENLRNQLNYKLKGKKMPKRQTVMLPINSNQRGSLTLVTRTNVKSKMIEYKTKTAAARLDLRPAEVKAIVKPKLKSPRKFSSSLS